MPTMMISYFVICVALILLWVFAAVVAGLCSVELQEEGASIVMT